MVEKNPKKIDLNECRPNFEIENSVCFVLGRREGGREE